MYTNLYLCCFFKTCVNAREKKNNNNIVSTGEREREAWKK